MEVQTTVAARRWKTLSGSRVDDIVAEVGRVVSGDKIMHVGTDSQQYPNHTEFVTVIVVLTPSKGGRVYWSREKRRPKIASLRERLFTEVWMSVELALELNDVIPEDTDMSVHVDANPDTKFESSKYVQELAGMVVGQGFSVLTKPESWAAMHVADHAVKRKHEGRY